MKTKIIKLEDGDEDGEVGSFRVSYVPEKTGLFTIEILDLIQHPSQFSDAIQILQAADEQNPVKIDLQCRGGSLGAADRFIHAMRKCEGPIHVVASGIVASAATFILLEADSFELTENFCALIHNGSLGNGGNLNEYKAKAAFDIPYMERALRYAYEGFLTEEEIDGVLRGDDMWLDGSQWVERWENKVSWMKKQVESMTNPPKPIKAKKQKSVKTKVTPPEL